MRAHQQDSVLAYQQALVRMNRLDDAAKILIDRLADANGYNKALQEAIAKVGHIERFSIPSANE